MHSCYLHSALQIIQECTAVTCIALCGLYKCAQLLPAYRSVDYTSVHSCYLHRPKKEIFNFYVFFFQPSDMVEVCRMNLHNESLWKAMSQDAISSVCSQGTSPLWPALPPLCAPVLDFVMISNDLEQQLRILVRDHRRVGICRVLVIL